MKTPESQQSYDFVLTKDTFKTYEDLLKFIALNFESNLLLDELQTETQADKKNLSNEIVWKCVPEKIVTYQGERVLCPQHYLARKGNSFFRVFRDFTTFIFAGTDGHDTKWHMIIEDPTLVNYIQTYLLRLGLN